MADVPSAAQALYPNLKSDVPAPETAPAADAGERSVAEKIYGDTPADGVAKRQEGIAEGVARPAAEVEAEATAQGEAGAFGLPAGALTDQFSAMVKEAGIGEATAGKMADLHRKGLTEASTQFWAKTGSDWEKSSRAQFGANLSSMVGAVQPLLNDTRLTTPGFVRLLNEYRLGNNPDVVRTLSNWAQAMRRR